MTAPESKTSKRILKAREREQEATRLRAAGATYEQIGRALGITRQAAHKAVMRSLERTMRQTEENCEVLRALTLARLEALLLVSWQQAQQGNIAAVKTARQITLDIAQLKGLPVQKQEIDLTSGGRPIIISYQVPGEEKHD